MSGRDARESAPGRHRFKRGRLYWEQLPGGGHYPFGLRTEKAEVLLLVGRWGELEELYRLDMEKAVGAGQWRQEAHLTMRQAELMGWRNEYVSAEGLFERAAGLYQQLGDQAGRLRCENGLVLVHINLKQFEKAEAIIENATARARGQGHRPALCSLLNSHAVLCRERKQFDRAISYLEERMEISRELEATADVASSHLNIAVFYTEKERFDLALENNHIALELGHRMGDVVLQEYALYNQAHLYRKMGRGVECLDCLRKALAKSKHLGNEQMTRDILKDISSVERAMSENRRIGDL